jgi:hypothetical protein
MKHLPLATVLIVAALFSACGLESKDTALGEYDVITIVCDSADYSELEDVIEIAFSQPIFTPQSERWFRVQRLDLGDLLDRKRERNIVIIAPLDAPHSTGDYMRKALDSTVRGMVRDGKEQVFVQKDLWYRGQTVMHLTAPTMSELRDFMAANASRLEYYFKSAWDEFERTRMLRLSREEAIEQQLLAEHDFTLAIIKDWFVAKDSSDIGCVLLRRQSPMDTERWLLVHWIDTDNTALLSSNFAYNTRNRLTEILYRTFNDSAWVVIDSAHYLQYDEVNFQGRFAIRMKGLWRMNDYSMGGPFTSYLFYEESQKRLYFIDGAAFAPKYEKKKLIQDLDVMISTFKPGPAASGPA